MVNAFPVSDGVQGPSPSLGSKSLSYSLNHNSGLWSSVDPTANYGTHPIVVDGSFSYTFSISGGGTFIEIFPTSIVVEPVGTGTNFCFGDGTGTACPCGNASAPLAELRLPEFAGQGRASCARTAWRASGTTRSA
jgi:hypothetical protein